MHTLSSIIKYRMKKDEEDIQAVMRAIQSFIVPFDDDGEELVSLMSGSVASRKHKMIFYLLELRVRRG